MLRTNNFEADLCDLTPTKMTEVVSKLVVSVDSFVSCMVFWKQWVGCALPSTAGPRDKS